MNTNSLIDKRSPRRGHTLMEMTVAMVASAMLLGGLGSVMLIARQVAFTPSAADRRIKVGDSFNDLANELRYATYIVQNTQRVLEFVVADRNADGTAEKIRYEWSGTTGDPLYKTINGGTAVAVANSVNDFSATYLLKSDTSSLTTTTDSAEAQLFGNTTAVSGADPSVTSASNIAQIFNPASFTSAAPANATCWNMTKIEFQARQSAPATDTLLVQLRQTGDPYDGPTGDILGQVTKPESTLTSSSGWNTATFSSPVRGLALHRKYAVVWLGLGSGTAARLLANDSASTGVSESADSGASWTYNSARQTFFRLWGTYTTPGTTYNITRNYVTDVTIRLQTGTQAHSRIDASVPLVNSPELLSAYWRTDFDRDPTTTNTNGDATADWAMTSGTFDSSTLIGGVWHTSGAIETRPLSNFTNVTTVDVRFRNTTTGGNGAMLRINADRQGGVYSPILVYLQRQSDGTQTLTLYGKSNDATNVSLCSRTRLPSDFIRVRLTIDTAHNIVNMHINDEDQGAFAYQTYAPSSTTDGYLTLYNNTSAAEFDYAEVRVATN